jgi:hypothetical protein
MPKDKLKTIHFHELVDGFHLTGNKNASCHCDTCAQAKIRRAQNARHRAFEDPARLIGDHVSTDVKSVPYESFEGYKYVVNFVDHKTRLGMCFFMRHKDEVVDKFKLFVAEMAHYGFVVKNLHSDRGSENFAQEGEISAVRDRQISALDEYCKSLNPPIKHHVTPVESKEKIAEAWFRDHFRAADAMLWEARLSPAFWKDAIAYSQFLANRTPNEHVGPTTPWSMLTGSRTRWDKFRVFGCDCYRHIPNDKFAKVPGIVRGQKLIFVGFHPTNNGYRVFDPETRRYFSTDNLYFYESFAHRIDALRHHDRRRKLLRDGHEQPVQINDFDDENAQGVRNLFLHPDAPEPSVSEGGVGSANRDSSSSAEADISSRAAAEGASPRAEVEGALSRAEAEGASRCANGGPLSRQSVAAERARRVLRSAETLRPLRLLAVGREVPWTVQDRDFLAHAERIEAPIAYRSPNPKRLGSVSRRRYSKYSSATTIREALELGASRADIIHDYRHGFIRFPKHESDLPGHVFGAIETAETFGTTHILEDVGLYVKPSDHADFMLAKAFASKGLERAKYVFNELLASAYEPGLLESRIEEVHAAARFAERQFAKVMNSSSVNIDFSLAPEPTRWEETLPEVCSESEKWKEAMDDEIVSMTKFGVYRRLPRSAAGNRQILGCRWVYKRKVNKHGVVVRHRARLVAQGFLQKPYDSFNPDETYSPVVHKDSLRLFLSVCAAENLRVYQADVKAAFLQAPLEEKIYVRAPPGYSSTAENGEEEILELSKAIYGLKQASSCFWTAMNEHLKSIGFRSVLGDPCLFRKELADGRKILVCTYIDDVTYGVSDPSLADTFLSDLRKRFVIDEGEGKPVEWLLGMAVTQDLQAGTIHLNMEMAITKLALGILTAEEIEKAKSVSYPMLAQPLRKEKERLVPKEKFDYLSVVGSLMHFANCVRCDVALSVGHLARHAATPGSAHVKAAKRVVQYLYNTRSLGITYRRQSSSAKTNVPLMFEGARHPLDNGKNLLQTFADSDYAADETRRSTIGNVIMMNGGPIAWTSILGKTVATSTCEAEVNAAVVAAKDAVHFSRMIQELKLAPKRPLQIAEDNSACIAQANAGLRYVRNAKHYEVKLRFLQQLVVDKEVEFVYCSTNSQLADFFTKPLDETKFIHFRNQLMAEL